MSHHLSADHIVDLYDRHAFTWHQKRANHCDAQEILTMSIDDVRQQIFHIYQLVKFMLCKPIAQNCGRYFDHCVPK
ncbi:hypothetical protein [Pseudomonas sp. DE0157]|uniref:hypothetical protein n=1 Tax=Pseudomonas sp. DE0157 TaxID=2584952 RepID=UPI00119E1A59|nr:hypothetical protein [Pseudomonas sp. DE0157]